MVTSDCQSCRLGETCGVIGDWCALTRKSCAPIGAQALARDTRQWSAQNRVLRWLRRPESARARCQPKLSSALWLALHSPPDRWRWPARSIVASLLCVPLLWTCRCTSWSTLVRSAPCSFPGENCIRILLKPPCVGQMMVLHLLYHFGAFSFRFSSFFSPLARDTLPQMTSQNP
jgi:hypothetical protein